MLILAIDLGKAKSLACWYQTDDPKRDVTSSNNPLHLQVRQWK